MKRMLLIAASAFSFHASSRADVAYDWVSVRDGKPADVAMTLVFSDEAVASGRLVYHVAPGPTSTPAGLNTLGFSVATIDPMTYDAATMASDGSLWRLDLDLTFNAAGYLTGRIFANDQKSDFTMSSDADGLFTFSGMHSDQDWYGTRITCNGAAACTSSGRLVRADALPSGQVPEPGSLALFGLGALAMLGLGRFVCR